MVTNVLKMTLKENMNSIRTTQCKHGKFSYFANDTIIGKSLDLYGEYCEQEFTVMEHIIKPTDYILDIGANIGLHTVWFAKHAFQGHVSSFEPNEFNRELLIMNLRHNLTANVEVYTNVIGNGISSCFISSYSPHVPGNYGECTVLINKQGPAQAAQMVTIDALKPIKCDFMKIDVEGYEMEVLKGAEATIDKFKPSMLIEVNASKEHIKFLWDNLIKRNYLLWWLPVRNYNPNNYRGNKSNVFLNSGVINIIACHKEKAHSNILDKALNPVMGETDTYEKMHQRL